jgi:hypothetical protein
MDEKKTLFILQHGKCYGNLAIKADNRASISCATLEVK